jgi:hypothetical protein
MSGTLAVYQKELAGYFRSPIAYYVVAVFLLGTGYFFLYNIFLTGETTMAGTFQNMGILFVTLAPLISMRLLAREYNAGTAELLLTLPLAPWQIVLGKYLGALTILIAIAAGRWSISCPSICSARPRRPPSWLAISVRAARHGVSRRGAVLLGPDAEPDRGRAHHGGGAAGAVVRGPPADVPALRRAPPRRAALSFALTSPTSSRASCVPRRSPSTSS